MNLSARKFAAALASALLAVACMGCNKPEPFEPTSEEDRENIVIAMNTPKSSRQITADLLEDAIRNNGGGMDLGEEPRQLIQF